MKLYIRLGQFFIDNFGLTSSFGFGCCMQRDMIILHQWEPVPCPGKSTGERFGGAKVILHVMKMKKFSIWRRFRDPDDLSGSQDRALTRNELHTWIDELASESNTIQAQ